MFHLQPLQFAVRSAARSGFIARIGFTLAELSTVIAVTGTLVALLPSVLLAETQFRTWTSISGKHTLEAEYVRVEEDKVILRKADGSLSQPLLKNLSEADQEFIEKMQSIPKPVLPAEEEQEETDAAEEESGIQRYISHGKFGLRDKNGAILTPAKYDHVWDFHEGLAMVNIGGRFGFLEGNRAGKFGFVDKSGKEVIPPKYDNAKLFSEGLACVGGGFIDKTGKEIISLGKYSKAKSFSEGFAAVAVIGEGGGWSGGFNKWGFIDKAGKEVIPPKYDEVESFSDGFAAVEVRDRGGWTSKSKWGFIDKAGKEVTPLKYDEVESFSEGLAAVRAEVGLDDKWGFIDKTGREVVPPKYDKAYSFSEGLARVVFKGNFGFIDKTGREVIPPKYYAHEVFRAMNSLPLKYEDAEPFCEGLACVGGGFIDKTGKEVIPPGKYSEAKPFSEGLARVKRDGRWGFIDKTGREVIPLKYEYAKDFHEGLAVVQLGRWGFIDKTGKEVIPLIYSAGEFHMGADDFYMGLASVTRGDVSGYVDKNGKEYRQKE